MPDKILLVDDDQVSREEMKCCLEEYDVIEAKNGQEALSILNKPNEIDLMILDIRMPGLAGTEVLKIIKKKESAPIVIMLTGFSSTDTAVESLRGQADEYLEKPIDIEKLKAVVAKLLEAKKYKSDDTGAADVNQKIDRVKRFIERNCLKRVSLEDAAKTVGFSPKYLSRVFSEVAGEGFMDYRLKVKTNKAKELLAVKGYTISDISDKLGFMNPESFMRIFKKITGLTPTQYREPEIKRLARRAPVAKKAGRKKKK